MIQNTTTATPYHDDLVAIDICLQSGLFESAAAGIRNVARLLDRAGIPADSPARQQLEQLRQRYSQAVKPTP